MHEIAGLGELREPWHSSQMSWLENHLSLINTYTTALENLDNYRGININLSMCRTLNIGEAAGDQTIGEAFNIKNNKMYWIFRTDAG